jgi:hypothetical protein
MKSILTVISLVLAFALWTGCGREPPPPPPQPLKWEYRTFDLSGLEVRADHEGFHRWFYAWKSGDKIILKLEDLANHLAQSDWEFVGVAGREITFRRSNRSPHFSTNEWITTTPYYP